MEFQKALLSSVCDISMGQAPKGSSYNTDGEGFLYSLQEALPQQRIFTNSKPLNLPLKWLEGKVVLLLGAGGAARAIAIQLALSGVARDRKSVV